VPDSEHSGTRSWRAAVREQLIGLVARQQQMKKTHTALVESRGLATLLVGLTFCQWVLPFAHRALQHGHDHAVEHDRQTETHSAGSATPPQYPDDNVAVASPCLVCFALSINRGSFSCPPMGAPALSQPEAPVATVLRSVVSIKTAVDLSAVAPRAPPTA